MNLKVIAKELKFSFTELGLVQITRYRKGKVFMNI